MLQEGSFNVVYGQPGLGKTTDALYSFGGIALFCHMEGALRTADTVVEYLPPYRHKVQTLGQVIALIPIAKAKGFSTIVVDDATLLMKLGDWPLLEASYGIIKDGRKSGHDRAMWNEARETIRNMGIVARNSGMRVILNCHEQAPDKEKELPGGPDFGWDRLVALIPHVACAVFRAVGRTAEEVAKEPWNTRMACHPSSSWIMKDRWNTAPPIGPMNMAELLRAAGDVVQRPQGAEWMEEVAEIVATGILGGTPQLEVTTKMRTEMVQRKIPTFAIKWALRDGVHRAEFRRYRLANALQGF